jgi:hypothetical protein
MNHYNIEFIGHYDLNKSLIADIRKVLRKSGFRLWVRGGNPDRKQHVCRGHSHGRLRSTLPLKFATYGRYYLRPTDNKDTSKVVPFEFAKDRVIYVVTDYVVSGVDVKKNVPAKLLK